jgi:hypothetical protein
MGILQPVKSCDVKALLTGRLVAYEIPDTPVKCEGMDIRYFESVVVRHKSYSDEATAAMMDELRTNGYAFWRLGPCVCRSLSGGSDFRDLDQTLLAS